jgi:hypothetical protein
MDFTFWGLIGGFVFGTIGLWFIRESRRLGRLDLVFIGLALIIFPYFVANHWLLWGVGAVLVGYGANLRR